MAVNWGTYVGIPWLPGGRTEHGCDCYGLAELVYRRELGLDIRRPLHPGADTAEASELIIDRSARPPWHRVAGTPQVFDLVIAELPILNEPARAYVAVSCGRGRILRILRGGLSMNCRTPERVLHVARHVTLPGGEA